MNEPVIIVEHDPRWLWMFEMERRALARGLEGRGGLVAIEHVGSTAVRGLAAKPVVDVMIGVERLAIVNESWLSPLRDLGYAYIAEFESVMPERRYFRKLDDAGRRTHQLHIVEPGGEFWRRHLAFRDYLRTHPAVADAYATLKRTLASRHRHDRDAYADGKSPFIQEIEALAMDWLRRRDGERSSGDVG